MTKKEVLLVGGDKRQVYMAQYLQEKGYKITCYGNDAILKKEWAKPAETLEKSMNDISVILMPMPVSRDGMQVLSQNSTIELNNFAKLITKKHIIFGGNIPPVIVVACKKKKAIYLDYMQMEDVAVLNAIATAEGAVCEAIIESEINLHGSKCLITGFGRCGEVLADKLHGLKAEVTVMARRKEIRARAEAYGYKVCDMKDANLKKYQFIFNTIPAKVFEKEEIDQIQKETILIELASAPYGVNLEYCRKKGIRAKLCPGLPGKYAPAISGVILGKAVEYSISNIV